MTVTRHDVQQKTQRVSSLTGLTLQVEWSDDGTGRIIERRYWTRRVRKWLIFTAKEINPADWFTFALSPPLPPDRLYDWLVTFLVGFDAGTYSSLDIPWTHVDSTQRKEELATILDAHQPPVPSGQQPVAETLPAPVTDPAADAAPAATTSAPPTEVPVAAPVAPAATPIEPPVAAPAAPVAPPIETPVIAPAAPAARRPEPPIRQPEPRAAPQPDPPVAAQPEPRAALQPEPRVAPPSASPVTMPIASAGAPRGPRSRDFEIWRDRFLEALYDEQCWFRRGMAALDVGERGGIPSDHVFAACRSLLAQGYIEVAGQQRGKGTLYCLTRQGVARVEKMRAPQVSTRAAGHREPITAEFPREARTAVKPGA